MKPTHRSHNALLMIVLCLPHTLYSAEESRASDRWEKVGPFNLKEPALTLTIATKPSHVIYVGSRPKGIYKSADQGKSWSFCSASIPSSKAAGINQGSLRVHPADHGLVYAGIETRGVYRTDDEAATWTQSIDGQRSGGGRNAICFAFDPRDKLVIYHGTDNGVHKSVDGGKTWKPLAGGLPLKNGPSAIGVAVDFNSPDTIYAAFLDTVPDEAGGVYRSPNAGKTWAPANKGLPEGFGPSGNQLRAVTLMTMDPSDPRTLYACAGASNFFRTTNGAEEWSKVDVGDKVVTSIFAHPKNPSILLVGINGGEILKTADGGKTWKPFSEGLETGHVGKAMPVQFKGPDGVIHEVEAQSSAGTSMVHEFAIDPQDGKTVYAATGDGLFRIVIEP